jgi:hypothetical protein
VSSVSLRLLTHCSFCTCALICQAETSELIGLSCEYPVRTYSASYKLFEPLTVDKRGVRQSEANNTLALYHKSGTHTR